MSAWSYKEDSGQDTGVGSLSFLQGIFPTQGSNPGLPHSRLILYQLSHQGRMQRTKSSMPQHGAVLICVWIFATPLTVNCQAPLFMGCSRQEYWSGLPFPSPGDLPNPGIEPVFTALQLDSLPTESSREAHNYINWLQFKVHDYLLRPRGMRLKV